MEPENGTDAYADVERELEAQLAEVRRSKENGTQPDLLDSAEVYDDDGLWNMTTKASKDPEPYVFRVDGQEMKAAKRMPGGFMLDMMEAKSSLRNSSKAQGVHIVLDMLAKLLYPESMQIITDRLRSPENPIEFEEVTKILNNLVSNVYGRPTQPLSPSSSERSTTGTSSTDGAQPATSTPEHSPTTGGSATSSTTGSSAI